MGIERAGERIGGMDAEGGRAGLTRDPVLPAWEAGWQVEPLSSSQAFGWRSLL